MCTPLAIAGIALTGASYAAKSMQQAKVDSARKDAMAAERIRQHGYDRETDALNAQSQNRYQDFSGQQDAKSKQLGDYFGGQTIEQDGANAQATAGSTQDAIMPTSSSAITVANEGAQRGKAAAYSQGQGEALGKLRSFGDLLGGIGRLQARDATTIGQIGGFKKGSSNVLPYELEAANSKGAGLGAFGDLLGLAGGVATQSGFGGSFTGGAGATPSVSGASAGVPSFATAASPYFKSPQLFSLGY